jgi:Ca2+/Na+ antiporter
MGALTLLLVPVLYNDSKMSRIEGGLLVIGYFVYTVLLF